MPIHFTQLSPDLADAALNTQVITPNERLAREVNAACNQRQLDQGRRAWPKPRATSLRRHLRTAFNAAAADVELLSAEAELLLWRDVAPGETRHLAEWAAEAWALTHAYRIDRYAPAFDETANGRLFQRWATRFDAQLKAEGWITEAQLADAAVAQGEDLHLLAFERIEPQATEYFARTERAGGRVHQHAPAPSTASQERRVRLNSRAQEISAAAQWARHALMADGQARIGVVFPYLTDAYHAIDHAFRVEFSDAPDAFDLSGGLPLAQQPVWQAADALIEHLLQPPEDAPERPVEGPFLKLPENLQALLPQPQEWRRGERPFADWVASFEELLGRARWGVKAGSGQFQARQDILDCLGRYRRLTQHPAIDAAQARQTLRDLLGTRVFAPQRSSAPIQVLGYLETTGMTFSHLWVADLSDSAWPKAPSPNPLIPMRQQLAAGIPRIDHDSEGAFAKQRLTHWRSACTTFIASWSEEDVDGRHECCPLIKSLPEAPIDQVLANHRARRHPALAELPSFDLLEPAPADQASRYEGDIEKGGATLIQNQAKCPFRAWAIHRLQLRPDTVDEPFADALTRGSLVHDAFFRLYRNGQGPFSDDRIQAVVEEAVSEQLQAMPDLFQALETERVMGIVKAWLDSEAKRPAFTVTGLEQGAELTLAGAKLQLRIDRIDRDHATGAKVVIDYKTGSLSVNQMVGERLVEPQLPMYALTDDAIEAVLVAEVGDKDVRLLGWSGDGINLGKTPEEGWNRLRRRWREQVQSLVDEFREGEARVDPHNPGNAQSPPGCRYCHLLSLCRRDAFGKTA